MELHKCKVSKCKLWMSTSRSYHGFIYYKLKIYYNGRKRYFYIRSYNDIISKLPFDNFSKGVIHHQPYHADPIFICNLPLKNHLISPKRETETTFHKYIEIYPDIIKLFESKDKYSIRIGLEILKQQLELNIQ